MAAGVHNVPVDIVRGDTYNGAEFEILVNAIPLPLTDYAIRCKWRSQSKSGTEQRDSSIGDGITVTDAANGLFTLDAFVVDFPVGRNYYDIEFTSPAGKVNTYVAGYMNVVQDVTY